MLELVIWLTIRFCSENFALTYVDLGLVGTVTINVCLFTIYIDLVLLACLHNKQQIAANKQKVTTHSAKTYTALLGLQN